MCVCLCLALISIIWSRQLLLSHCFRSNKLPSQIVDSATSVSSGSCTHGMGGDSSRQLLLDGGGGPSADELLRLLDQCDLSNSLCSTPCQSPFIGDGLSAPPPPPPRIKTQNVAFLNQMRDRLMLGQQLGGQPTASGSCSAGSSASAAND